MANRFPLILDTTDGNKIKELPDGDNLDLTNTSITSVNDVTSVGTIRTQELLVRGNTISPVNFSDLVDTPATLAGSANYFVKVNATGDAIEFRPLTDLGTLNVDSIVSAGDLTPSVDGAGNIGTDSAKWSRIRANQFVGDLVSQSGSVVFNSATGLITYAAIQGVPQFLSEFTDDIGYLRTADLDDTLSSLFSSEPFTSDIRGSVVADDSTVIIDGVAGLVVGDIQNQNTESGSIVAGDLIVTNVEVSGTFVFNGAQAVGLTILDNIKGVGGLTLTTDGTLAEELINITPALADGEVNIDANKIRLLGDVSSPITASGGFVGDLTGSVVSDNSTVIIDGVAGKIVSPNITGTATFENNVVVVGNLTVQGTTTEINSTTLTVDDLNIVVANGAADATAANGAGLTVDGANATLTYTSADDRWNFNKELNVARVYANVTGDLLGNVTGNLTGDSAGTHTGPVVGTVSGEHIGYQIGDMTGSVFGDDSTLLVDAINGLVVGDYLNTAPDNSFFEIKSLTDTIYLEKTNGKLVINGAAADVYLTSTTDLYIGTGTTNDVTIGHAGNTVQLPGTIDLNGATVNNATFNLTGNVDATALTLGATATTVAIGHAGSTTTINGAVSFANALIANDITSDDSITLRTDGNTNNEAINLAPQGTGNTINLTSQNIRFFGPITNNVNFTGGLNGDLNGSVYGDDSTLLIDGVNSIISAGNLSGSLPAIDGSNLTGVVASSVDFTNITNIPTTIAGYGIIDAATSAQGILAETALQDGDSFDVRGSVFADDSSLLVDAVNGEIPGYVKIADLKTALQDGAGDYAAFKSWILANL